MLRLQHKLHDDDDESVAVAQAKTVLAQALVKVPALDEALPLLNSALNAHMSKGRHGDRLRVANLLCHVYRTGGRLEDAEILLKESIAACVEKDGAKSNHALHFIFQLGNVLASNDNKLEEAEKTLREAVAGLTEVLGPDKEDTLNASGALAMLLRKRKKEAEAEPILEATLNQARSKLGPQHRITLSLLNNLGVMYSAEGRLEESEVLYREALATKRSVRAQGLKPLALRSRL